MIISFHISPYKHCILHVSKKWHIRELVPPSKYNFHYMGDTLKGSASRSRGWSCWLKQSLFTSTKITKKNDSYENLFGPQNIYYVEDRLKGDIPRRGWYRFGLNKLYSRAQKYWYRGEHNSVFTLWPITYLLWQPGWSHDFSTRSRAHKFHLEHKNSTQLWYKFNPKIPIWPYWNICNCVLIHF